MKVFLGGTVNKSTWRQNMIPRLKIDYFNPIVEEWTTEAQEQELFEREHCDYCLYIITPRMTGYYSIAEIIDDSFKRPDRTIYSYITEDDEFKFNEQQISELEKIKKIVENNGGLYIKTIDEVVKFLNSANSLDKSIINEEIKDVFISYGRRHSLDFAKKLHDNLTADGFKVWFDMNNIPLGVDFQEQIDEGIQKADSFIYIMSPHSVKSEYCLKEVILALKYNKRIIPVLHIEPSDCWDKIHSEIGRRNWIYMREQADDNIPRNEWKQIDNFENAYVGLRNLLNLHKDYVRKHTILLNYAINWHQNQRITNLLIVGNERKEAEDWLVKNTFRNEKNEITQAPCLPTNLHAEYICEAKKNANNLLTDTFLSYSVENKPEKDKIYKALIKRGITVWLHTNDIEKGEDFEEAIKRGIEQADNFIYLISNNSVVSKYCLKEIDYALKLNKRIIPILIEKTNISQIPEILKKCQYIDFSECIHEKTETKNIDIQLSREEKIKIDVDQRREKTPFELKFDQLLFQLQDDADYYQKHKVFLVQALRWEQQNRNQSVLLRGYNLENAKTWLKLGNQKTQAPLQIHKDFISESELKTSSLNTEVFISYSRTDGDFARKLNLELQFAGKTTWFDQESIASSADFQKEINKGIESSNNFIFVISSDSINSPYCNEEVKFAASLNKRIITVLLRAADTKEIPETLSKIQWIDFEKKNFSISFHELIRTLDTDRDHVQKHTQYSQLANEWLSKNKDEDLLLRGSEFTIADEWLKTAINEKKQPSPTIFQTDFLKASDDAIQKALKAKKNAQIAMRFLTIAAVIGLFVSLFFMLRARKAMIEAREKEKSIQALYLASMSKEIMNAESVKALQLAYAAYQLNTENTHPFIIKAFTDVFNNFMTGKKAYFIDEIYLSNGLLNATYSTDGSKLFAFSYDSIKVWNSEGKEIIEFCDSFYSAAFSDDGKYIFTHNDYNVNIYDTSATKISTISTGENYIYDLIVDNDKFILVSGKNSVSTYDFTGKLISNFNFNDSLFSEYEYIKNEDKFITVSSARELVVWSLNGDTILNLKNYFFSEPVVNQKCNMLIGITENDTISVYNLDGSFQSSFKKKFVPKFVKLSPDGSSMIIQKNDDNLILSDLKGNQIYKFNMQDSVASIKFCNDSKKAIILTSIGDFYLWDFSTGNIVNFAEYDNLVNYVDFVENHDLVITYSTDNSAKLWNLDGSLQLSLEGHSEKIINHSLSDNERLLTFSYDGTAKIWDISKTSLPLFKGHEKPINYISSSADGKYIVSAAQDKTLKIWDKDGGLIYNYITNDYFNDIIFSSNSEIFAAFDSEKISIYDIKNDTIYSKIYIDDIFDEFLFSDDANYYVTCRYDDNKISISNVFNEKISEIEIEQGNIKRVVFHDQNNIFVLTDNNSVYKYNINAEKTDEYSNSELEIIDIDWNNDNLLLIMSSIKNNNLIIDKFGLDKPVVIKGNKDEISNAYFTENNNFVYTISNENIIKFWNLQGELISTFYENIDDIGEIVCSETENLALVFYLDGSLKIIDIEGGYDLIDINDNVTDATFSSDGRLYLAKDNEIEILYTIAAAIKWLDKNNIPPLSERDKEKYGIVTKKDN